MVYEGNEVFTEGLIELEHPHSQYTPFAKPKVYSAGELAYLLSDDKMYIKERYTWYVLECIRLTKIQQKLYL